MSLHKKIRTDYQQARILRSVQPASILRFILGEFDRVGKSVDDAKIVSIINKTVKDLEMNFSLAPGRFLDAPQEVQILKKYLPPTLSEEVLRGEIAGLKESGLNQGAIMKTLKENHPGQYDPKRANEIISGRA